jgi:mono/diheme cytochrome c family protein
MFGKRIENRILVGVTSFVAIMVLVGWVAINEGGRMLAFEEQFNARSIERGAALFTTNCITCHGADARGIQGMAPGLNNPQLFGHNFVGEFEDQIDALTKEMANLQAELAAGEVSGERATEINTRLGTDSIAAEQYAVIAAQAAAQAEAEAAAEAAEAEATPTTGTAAEATPAVEPTAMPTEVAPPTETTDETSLETEVEEAVEAVIPTEQQALLDEQTALEDERTVLQTELATEGLSEERINEINTRITEINTRLGTDTIPFLLVALQGQRDTILNSLGVAVEKGYDPEHPSRVEQIGWAGSLESFINTTLIHGRPLSGFYWPQGKTMPPWSQLAGGPLRNDQLQDLTNYIMNFDKGDAWTLEDLFAVNQFGILPGAGGGGVEEPVCDSPAACDVAAVTTELMALTGDPQNGQTLYNSGILACAGCHIANGGVIAPHLDGTWTRVVEDRLTLPEFAGYTGEQYLVESILLPNNFTVPPYAGAMPTNFGTRLDVQMLADLVAFLQSQDGPSPE